MGEDASDGKPRFSSSSQKRQGGENHGYHQLKIGINLENKLSGRKDTLLEGGGPTHVIERGSHRETKNRP